MEKMKSSREKTENTEIAVNGGKDLSVEERKAAPAPAEKHSAATVSVRETTAPLCVSKEEAEKKKKEEAEKKKKRAAAKAYRDKYFAYYDDVKTKVSEDW